MFNFLSFLMSLLQSIPFKHAIHFLACITPNCLYNDQKCGSVFTPQCDEMIFLVTYTASPQGQKVVITSTAHFCGRFIFLRSNQNILQSAAVWFCHVVSYAWCSTFSSGSVHASQRTLSLIMVTVTNYSTVSFASACSSQRTVIMVTVATRVWLTYGITKREKRYPVFCRTQNFNWQESSAVCFPEPDEFSPNSYILFL